MTPLTSTPACESCVGLSEKIAELEQRISTLYKIREEERYSDSIIFGPAQAPVTTAEDLADTAPYLPDAATPPAATSTPPAVTAPAAASVSAPVTVPQDAWLRLGAKPKALVSSTPTQPETHPQPWVVVGDQKKRGRLSKPPVHASVTQDIQSVNRYDVLDLQEFPPLAGDQELLPSSRVRPRFWSPANFTARPPRRRASAGLDGPGGASLPFHKDPESDHSQSPTAPGAADVQRRKTRRQAPFHHRGTETVTRGASDSSRSPHRPIRSPPSTLIIGDSIVRNVSVHGAHTLFFPGATVQTITDKVPDIIKSYPEVDRVVIHVGTNDIQKQQSELLKRDFISLFNVLKQSSKRVHISGPTPTLGRGVGRFSRLLGLNTWLSSACDINGLNFIDNFNLFWQRGHLFCADGLHPNRAGARMLSANLAYGVYHPRAPKSTCPPHPRSMTIHLSNADRSVTN